MCSAETAVSGEKDKEVREEKEEQDAVHKEEEINKEEMKETVQSEEEEEVVTESIKELPPTIRKPSTKIQQPWQVASDSSVPVGIEQVKNTQ